MRVDQNSYYVCKQEYLPQRDLFFHMTDRLCTCQRLIRHFLYEIISSEYLAQDLINNVRISLTSIQSAALV